MNDGPINEKTNELMKEGTNELMYDRKKWIYKEC